MPGTDPSTSDHGAGPPQEDAPRCETWLADAVLRLRAGWVNVRALWPVWMESNQNQVMKHVSFPSLHPGRSAGHPSDLSAGAMLSLVASGRAKSRSDLIESLKWSRATVTNRLSFLLDSGLLAEAAETIPSGGRPTRVLKVNTDFGVVLSADIGERATRLAVTDLVPTVLKETSFSLDVQSGPLALLERVADGFLTLLEAVGRPSADVVGIGLSLPAPVDFTAGRVVGPSVMRGWDDFDICGWMASHFEAPCLVENDVNLMTLTEARRFWPDMRQLFYVKIGTGIGSGIVADGHLYRGAQGAAGDIGHIQIHGTNGPLCRCGKLGCVEASASGWSIARDLRAVGIDAWDARDVLDRVRHNDQNAIALVRAGGRIVGEVICNVVSVLNPSVIVVGGTLAEAGEHLLAGIRELVYQRSLPLATRELVIAAGHADPDLNIVGAAILVLEAQMRPGAADRVIVRHARRTARSDERKGPTTYIAPTLE